MMEGSQGGWNLAITGMSMNQARNAILKGMSLEHDGHLHDGDTYNVTNYGRRGKGGCAAEKNLQPGASSRVIL
ncbi:MAG: hypothetical protein ACLR0U_03540 [Enterocloster clostridioformis]